MTYPECLCAFDSKTAAGKIVHRVCCCEGNPAHHKRVDSGACAVCKGLAVGIRKRGYTYAEALVRWGQAGFPTRSNDQVERIYQSFCEPCKWRGSKNHCSACGCRVAKTGWAIRNKIKMVTEHCPKGLW